MERMRGAVAGLLWNLVLHRSDLLGNLTSMRNYFLLGRGDFYQQFLDEVGGRDSGREEGRVFYLRDLQGWSRSCWVYCTWLGCAC